MPPPPDARCHRLTVHVPHDEVHQSLPLADAVNRNDVRMGETSGSLGLAGEPLPDVLLESELGRQHLDRYATLKPFVTRAIDHAHTPAANLSLDGISVSKGVREADSERPVGRHGNQSVPALPERQPNFPASWREACELPPERVPDKSRFWGQFGREPEGEL
jgi:hypothetical protein